MSRLLLLGMRRFVQREPRYRRPWTIEDALSFPTIDPVNTPTAWDRLARLRPFFAADLLPPGAGWDVVDAAESAARLLPAIRDRFACCVLMGARVREAFVRLVPELRGASLLDVVGGFAIAPTPHARGDQTWWSYLNNTVAFDEFAGRVRALV